MTLAAATANPLLSEGILGLHLAVIAFNLFGLVVIPIGAWRGWTFVGAPGWRTLHLASLAVVAAQAIVGRACFLTLWQDRASGAAPSPPLIMRWVNAAIFWPLPIWVFEAIYLLVFAYTVALFVWLAPPQWRRWRRTRGGCV